MAVNMDHAQLRFPNLTAALQLSSAMHRYRLPGGLPARLYCEARSIFRTPDRLVGAAHER